MKTILLDFGIELIEANVSTSTEVMTVARSLVERCTAAERMGVTIPQWSWIRRIE